jgi:6-phosphogluconate dehydrogenase
MQIGYIGLGKMGFNMSERLLEKKYELVAYDPNKDVVDKIARQGALPASSAIDLVSQLKTPRVIWIMVPYMAVDAVLREITAKLEPGDAVIDGGNSPYKESIRRAGELEAERINFLDVGVSGGPSGARNGACLMIGGKKEVFAKYEQLFKDLSAEITSQPRSAGLHGSYGYMGRSGAGHFVKMVHNGIEYGMMQAIAEGFAVMKKSQFGLDLEKVAEVYSRQSVISSRLIDWLKSGYAQYGQDLKEISGQVAHSGEGLWTIEAAKELGVPTPVIENALKFRLQSKENPSYTGQVVSVLRNMFGGHEVVKK